MEGIDLFLSTHGNLKTNTQLVRIGGIYKFLKYVKMEIRDYNIYVALKK